jgi:hypothetical protein
MTPRRKPVLALDRSAPTADILRTMLHSPVAAVLFANALWLVVCSIWAVLCFAQAGKDRAAGTGFQKPIGPNDID